MKRWIFSGVLLTALLAIVTSQAPAAPVIGTFDASRASEANLQNGLIVTQARASLATHFPEATIAGTPTLTPAFLAGVDVMVVTSGHESGGITLSPAEQSALFNYVKNGGRALILADEYVDHDSAQSVLTPFGVTIEDDNKNGLQYGTIQNPSHPIWDGPWGVQSQFAVLGAGVFTDLGPYAISQSTMNSTGLPILASIESGVIAAGSGRVLLYADATPFADPIAEGYFSEAETLFLNSVSYLLVPEPASSAMAVVGMLVVGLVGWRSRKR